MGSSDNAKPTFHVEAAKKRVKELAKETMVSVPEGTGGSLTLSDHQLGDPFSVHVSLAVEWNASLLTVLDVSFNKFADGLARALGDMTTPHLPVLHTVNLSSNKCVIHSFRFLNKAPALTHVDLSLNHLGMSCAKHLAAALPPQGLKALVSLDLSSNKLLDDGCDLICHALTSRKNALQSLTLSMNLLTDAAGIGLANMVAASSIRQLVVSGNLIGDYGASAIAFAMDRSTHLDALYLDGNAIGPPGVFAFLNILRSNPGKSYQVLCLDDNPTDQALIDQVSQTRLSHTVVPYIHSNCAHRILEGALAIGFYLALNPTLTRLNLSGNQITDVGAFGLAKGLLVNSSLTELHVGSNRLGDAGVSSIYATSFDNKKSVLATIHVKGNLHSSEGDTIVHAIVQSKALATQLREATPVVLDLSYVATDLGLRRFGADVLAEHFQRDGCDDALPTSTSTTTSNSNACEVLNLCRNGLGDDGARSIASLFLSNATITKLDLSCNGIGDVGAAALAAMLRVNKSLRAVNLRAAYGASSASSCVISEVGMLELSAAMQVNTGIQVLDLRDHCANPRVVTSWVHMLQHNTGLLKFNEGTPAAFLARHDHRRD
ncbi:hypothetical protein DYB25_000410 [Aphanomyces astaci]|uniref:Uncharacterized protein n=1 Tax=Aphanomyces astaci TaxID=112090 RepID=A0A397FCW9_APHAT|nr:hypothetical protein DYB25_000410 [Aphanomyces astaci]RHZ15857.1 hypothetical protein DYB31_003191 [Aphanomyces astaci]